MDSKRKSRPARGDPFVISYVNLRNEQGLWLGTVNTSLSVVP